MFETFLVLLPGLEVCQHKCYMSNDCASYNLGPREGMTRKCELSTFDHVTLPDKVVATEGFEYCGIKVRINVLFFV